ncbi:MAG: hypothetical protein M3126_06790 [Candidatus Eremiobacteraeota bacterium]|nr:hypothetical protein [Candidatus Eremiobacteraeota bacterium]
MKNIRLALGAATFSLAMWASAGVLAVPASAQTVNAQTGATINSQMHPGNLRGERGSLRSITQVRRHLERLIDSLQRDQRDYGGHRVRALELMQQAREQLLQAERTDARNPGQ